jgi:hypothetical protein
LNYHAGLLLADLNPDDMTVNYTLNSSCSLLAMELKKTLFLLFLERFLCQDKPEEILNGKDCSAFGTQASFGKKSPRNTLNCNDVKHIHLQLDLAHEAPPNALNLNSGRGFAKSTIPDSNTPECGLHSNYSPKYG